MIVRTAYPLFACLMLVMAPGFARASSAQLAMQFATERQWPGALETAYAAQSTPLVKLIQWQYMMDNDSGATFPEIMSFVQNNPEWPDLNRLRVRAELSLRDYPVDPELLLKTYRDTDPLTGIGRMSLAQALMETSSPPLDRITTLVREGWISGDFDEAQERQILAMHRGILTQEDDIARTDRLLWEEKTSAAERMLGRLPAAHKTLVQARIALIENSRKANSLVAAVSSSLKKDPGLIYDRMRYRARRGDDEGVREMLLAAPETVPYAEKWWRTREIQIRKAIDEKNYKTAARLLANHSQTDGSNLADATWLKGWIALEFTHETQKAYDTFAAMYDNVRYPVSRARAAYWTARAAERASKNGDAERWYKTAASYPTTFYGQLALVRFYGKTALNLPSDLSPSSGGFGGSHDLTHAIRICMQLGELSLASKLISHMAENAPDDTQAAYAASMGYQAGLPYLSVRGAKKALQRNLVLTGAGYPRPQTPVDLPIERALVLSITRQESEFDSQAKSRAGALGLMQLLPSTAQETARKIGLPYSKVRLFSEDYNMTLGSYYLSRLISAYDGSYVMAIAAYNAGPGNVSKWSRQFGTPGNNIDSAVNWIEKIPFAETRNYVQRVLENVQVYRHLESEGTPVLLAEDLTR